MLKSIEQVSAVCGMLWEKGWAERNGGNITINLTDELDGEFKSRNAIAGPFAIGTVLPKLKGKYFFCKGTGKRMRDLAVDPMANGSIIRICDDCASYEIVAERVVMPTSELPSHLILHNYLTAGKYPYNAVLHTHPTELVAMSHSQKFLDGDKLTRLLWSMIPETLAFAPLGIGVVPYALPSSVRLAEATLEEIKKHDVVLWEKHGTVAVGKDITDAFDQTDVLNKAAMIYVASRNMGFEPDGLTPQAVQELRDTFNLPDKR